MCYLSLRLKLASWKAANEENENQTCPVRLDQKRLTTKNLNLNFCPNYLIISARLATPVALETILLMPTPVEGGEWEGS